MEEPAAVRSREGTSAALEHVLEHDAGMLGRRRVGRHRWIIRRLFIGLGTFVLVSIIVFAATQTLPGDAARLILGRSPDPAALEALRQQLGLDQSAVAQYLDWAGGVLTGDFGTSYTAKEPVSALLGPAVVNSGVLLGLSTLIAVILSVLVGVAAAARRDGWLDRAFNAFAFLFTAVPEFIVGILLVIAFSTTLLHVLPAVSLIPPGDAVFSEPDIFVLPTATLVLAITPYLGRLIRGSMIDVLESEYVRMARLKGISERRILFRHALPNALVPAIQGTAVAIGYLAGGIVAVEFVFGFPGIGTALLNAVSERDIPMIQAAALVLASVYVVVNLAADILVVLVTPRLRTSDAL
jgi:peptide/nickel transport system permease protein